MIARRYLLRWFVPLPIRTAITVVRGLRYVARGISTLMSGSLTVDVLDGAAIGASLLQRNYESAGTVMFLLGVSGLLEDYTKARTRTALTGSLAVKVDKVWVVKDGVDALVDMKDVQVNDLVRIRSGSMIPVDGRVMEGEAFVNESTMTGESNGWPRHGRRSLCERIDDDGRIQSGDEDCRQNCLCGDCS